LQHVLQETTQIAVSVFSERAMRRIWLLSLLTLPLLLGASASVPTPAQAQDVFGLLRAPMRIIQNLGVRGRLHHRRHRARPAAVTRGPETRSEIPRGEIARDNRALPAGYWADGFEDLTGFAFAPAADDRFWQHGSFDILSAALSPSATTRSQARRAAHAKNMCDGNSATAEQNGSAVYQELERVVGPTAEQQDMFKSLREAMIAASRRIEAACAASYATARPAERLSLLADRLGAMHQATLIVRTPLEAAYNALSEEQKRRLDGSNAGSVSCTGDLAAAGAWPGAEIMRAVQPNETQQAALERFRGTFLGMSQWLASSCPQQSLDTVIARLDAAGDRLNAMLYATRMVGRSLNGVYAVLENDQKVKLQSAGRQLRLGIPRAELTTR
jgi:hypothetical protein